MEVCCIRLLFFVWLSHASAQCPFGFCPGPLTCPDELWKCRDTDLCISTYDRCDGHPQCDDHSDEQNCVCGANQWQCSNNPCISIGQRCDGHNHCRDASDEHNCGSLYDGDLRISPPHFASNGSQAVTLTCSYSGVYPRPDHYEWSITACRDRSSGNTCTFTPDPTAEEFKTVRCRALRSVGNRNVAAGSIRVHLNISYPPSDKPVIQSQNSGRGYLQPGDVVTCTVTGGSPPVESVHLSCLDPSLPDQDDQRGVTAVASSVIITSAVHDDDDVKMTCICNATWIIEPEYYQLTSTAVYNVGRQLRRAVWLTVLGAVLIGVVILATCIAVFSWVRRYKVRETVDSTETSAPIRTTGPTRDRFSGLHEHIHEHAIIPLGRLPSLPEQAAQERPLRFQHLTALPRLPFGEQRPLALLAERPLPPLPDYYLQPSFE